MVTVGPRLSNSDPMATEASLFPKDESTPPVTDINGEDDDRNGQKAL